jgi:F-type H+-transporting ATPase subunit epsilon
VNGQVEELAIGAGFVEVSQEKVTVLTDLAVTDAEIDEAKVEEAMKRAEEALTKIGPSQNTEEVAALQGAIAKSMAQLKLKRKRRQI